MFRFCTACLLLPGGPGQALGAEEQRSLVTHFGARPEALLRSSLCSAPLRASASPADL